MRPFRLAPVLVAATLLAGCGGDSKSKCDGGQAKLDECHEGLSEGIRAHGFLQLPVHISEDCTDLDQCQGRCLSKASCAAVYYVLISSADPEVPPGAPELRSCLEACFGIAAPPD